MLPTIILPTNMRGNTKTLERTISTLHCNFAFQLRKDMVNFSFPYRIEFCMIICNDSFLDEIKHFHFSC